MTDLEDVFGEDFAETVQQRAAERRQERNRVTQEQMKKICSLAINENKFDPESGDPMFSFTTDNGLTHQVLLMQVPDPEGQEVWEHLAEPWEGAARLPLEYLGQWYWSTFPNKEELRKLDQGDHCIVVGNVEENEGDNGEVYRNIYPVRGVATLDEAKEYAEEAMSEEFSDEEEDELGDFGDSEAEEESESEKSVSMSESVGADSSTEDEDEEESDSTTPQFSSGDSGGGGLESMIGGQSTDDTQEDDSPVEYEPIAHMVEHLAEEQGEDEEPKVFELELGSPFHQRLTTVVINRLDDEHGITSDHEEQVKEIIGDVIESHREGSDEDEDEEEDDDDDMNKLF